MAHLEWTGNAQSNEGLTASIDGATIELMRFKPDGIGKCGYPTCKQFLRGLWIVYITEGDPYQIQPVVHDFVLHGCNANQATRRAEGLADLFIIKYAQAAQQKGGSDGE